MTEPLWAAAYCRVSTDQEDQLNSFESQQRYFRTYIQAKPEWQLYQIYADEGISGTSTRKRAAFHAMMADARQGRFRLILTKEVSRFSRNILDTITYTRALRQLGVTVLFLNDGISTDDPDAELRLSIMGSLAQEESRKTSQRVKWGQTRQMERGVVFGRSLLGYEVAQGRLVVEPEGAEIVRRIFYQYGVEKKGTATIARELREAGIPTSRGNVRWSASHIVKILKNEKYVGDLVQKKTITPNFLTHKKQYNHGEEPLVALTAHHPPIIDRALWEAVQGELLRRRRQGAQGSGHANRYPLSGKICCGECGSAFVARRKVRKDGSSYRRWGCCRAANEGRKRIDPQGNVIGCDVGRLLREELAMELFCRCWSSLSFDRQAMAAQILQGVGEVGQIAKPASGEEQLRLQNEAAQLERKKTRLMDAYFSETITQGEFHQMKEHYDQRLVHIQERLRLLAAEPAPAETGAVPLPAQVADILGGRSGQEALCSCLLERMTVFQDGRVEVALRGLPHRWRFQLTKGTKLREND